MNRKKHRSQRRKRPAQHPGQVVREQPKVTLCGDCGLNPARNGSRRCQGCADKHQEEQRKATLPPIMQDPILAQKARKQIATT